MNIMKKYLLMLAAFVAATATFTACSSEEDITLTDEQEQGVVKAQFNISIPQTTQAVTRTTPERVQFTQDIREFLGMKNIFLLPYILESGTSSIKDLSSKGTIVLREMVKPESMTVTANTIPNGKLVGASNSVLFGDVELTLGTNRFLFYGEAIPATTTDGGNDFKNGQVVIKNNETVITDPTVNASIKPSQLDFSLKQIGKTEGDDTKEEKILAYLKLIAQAQLADNNTWSGTSDLDMRILYDNFTGTETGTPHNLQGSSLYLQASILELYQTMLAKRVTEPSNMADAVCNAIENETYVTYNSSAKTLSFKDDILGYPEKLPDGAATLLYNTINREFSYVGAHDYSNGATTPTTLNVAAIDRYVYPASLFYMAESTIKTSKSEQKDAYDGTNTWDQILAKYDTDDGSDAIRSTTRSIALVSPVNYAVGRFDVKVAAASSGTTTTTIKDADNSDVTLANLELTGVLVGQQRNVDWEFKAKETSAEFIIYDNIEQSCGKTFPLTTSGFDAITNSYERNSTGAITSYTQKYNHVLVFPTREYVKSGNTSSGDQKVKIVLEFRNKGGEFVGKDGRIPTGCKFYLIGELDMDKVVAADKKSDYIFQKDHITTAKITVENLSKAIRSIPDLRNPQIELGLSVDLTWQEGNTFDVTIN